MSRSLRAYFRDKQGRFASSGSKLLSSAIRPARRLGPVPGHRVDKPAILRAFATSPKPEVARAAAGALHRLERGPLYRYTQSKKAAADVTTPPEHLEKLSANDIHMGAQTRLGRHRLVAENPQTPVKALEDLAMTVPDSVVKNPAWPLHLMENPGVLHEWSRAPLAHLVHEGFEPAKTAAATHPDNSVRSYVAGTTSDPKLLERFSNDAHGGVREEVAANPRAPSHVLVQLAQDQDHYVRSMVTLNPRTPYEVLLGLEKDPVYGVRAAAEGWRRERDKNAKALAKPQRTGTKKKKRK